MTRVTRSSLMPAWLAALGLGSWVGVAPAGNAAGHSHAQGHDHAAMAASEALEACRLHQGVVSVTKENRFETVVGPDGLRIYRYAANDVPATVGSATGTVTLTLADGSIRELDLVPAEPHKGDATAYFCPGHPQATRMEPGICEACGSMRLMAQDHLVGPYKASGSSARPATAAVHLQGLSGPETEVRFSVDFPSEHAAHPKG